jgi:hypothetical protein
MAFVYKLDLTRSVWGQLRPLQGYLAHKTPPSLPYGDIVLV